MNAIKINKGTPPPFETVIIAGGIGMWDGRRWVSMMHDSYERPIEWNVKWWARIPYHTDLFNYLFNQESENDRSD